MIRWYTVDHQYLKGNGLFHVESEDTYIFDNIFIIQVMLCIYYRPPNEERTLRSLEHRRATKVAHEFVSVQCGGKVSDVSITEGLISAYKQGWET